jgi:hypothetical protein
MSNVYHALYYRKLGGHGSCNLARRVRIGNCECLKLVHFTGGSLQKRNFVIEILVGGACLQLDILVVFREIDKLLPGKITLGCRLTSNIINSVLGGKVAVPEIGHLPVEGMHDTIWAIIHISGT